MYVCVCVCMYVHTCVCVCTYTQNQTHTHTHTHTRSSQCLHPREVHGQGSLQKPLPLAACPVLLDEHDFFQCSPLATAIYFGHSEVQAVLKDWGAADDALAHAQCKYGQGGLG